MDKVRTGSSVNICMKNILLRLPDYKIQSTNACKRRGEMIGTGSPGCVVIRRGAHVRYYVKDMIIPLLPSKQLPSYLESKMKEFQLAFKYELHWQALANPMWLVHLPVSEWESIPCPHLQLLLLKNCTRNITFHPSSKSPKSFPELDRERGCNFLNMRWVTTPFRGYRKRNILKCIRNH